MRASLLCTVSAVSFDNTIGVPSLPKNRATALAVARATGDVIASLAADVMEKRDPDSGAMVEYWDLTDTIVDGITAMRKAGEKYLPRFPNETDKRYTYRLNGSTKLTNIYRDTVEGLASKPFEQEISLVKSDEETVPADIAKFAEDVDGSGNNLTMYSSQVFFNGINSAIHWIYVDHPVRDPNVRSVADYKAAGLRPYWSHVLGRNVLAARSAMIDGKETLTYVKVFEPGVPDHIREFTRDANGVVTWKLSQKTDRQQDGKTYYEEVGTGTISIGEIPLVPFITGRRDGRSFRLFPAMRDAADLQVELYQQESGLKWIKIVGAYSMLAGNGVKPDKDAAGNIKDIEVGPTMVLYAAPANDGSHGSWSFVQPDASVMTFLAGDVKETISQLRELGRQPLTAQSGNITVITASAAAGKAKSAVGAWALGLKDALENAMRMTAKFMTIPYEPEINVYTEFDAFTEGKDLDALATARAARDISHETYISEMKRRAVLAPEVTAEVERERLLDEVPSDGVDTTLDTGKDKEVE